MYLFALCLFLDICPELRLCTIWQHYFQFLEERHAVFPKWLHQFTFYNKLQDILIILNSAQPVYHLCCSAKREFKKISYSVTFLNGFKKPIILSSYHLQATEQIYFEHNQIWAFLLVMLLTVVSLRKKEHSVLNSQHLCFNISQKEYIVSRWKRPVLLCCFRYEAFLTDKSEPNQRCLGGRKVQMHWSIMHIQNLVFLLALLCISRQLVLFLRHVCSPLSAKAFSQMRWQNLGKARFSTHSSVTQALSLQVLL